MSGSVKLYCGVASLNEWLQWAGTVGRFGAGVPDQDVRSLRISHLGGVRVECRLCVDLPCSLVGGARNLCLRRRGRGAGPAPECLASTGSIRRDIGGCALQCSRLTRRLQDRPARRSPRLRVEYVRAPLRFRPRSGCGSRRFQMECRRGALFERYLSAANPHPARASSDLWGCSSCRTRRCIFATGVLRAPVLPQCFHGVWRTQTTPHEARRKILFFCGNFGCGSRI